MAPRSRWSSEPRPSATDYDARWRDLEAAGASVHGEADFVAGFAPASVLDAGCGTGRVAIELARRGIEVVGVDLDAGFIAGARAKAPALDWRHDDLATVRLDRRFDLIVLAGNVMIFLTPGTESTVLANLAGHLAPGGKLVTGFQLDGGRLSLAAFDEATTTAGLSLIDRFGSWDRDAYRGQPYAVSVLTTTERARMDHRGG